MDKKTQFQEVFERASRLRERQRVEAQAAAERLERQIQGDLERAKLKEGRHEQTRAVSA